MKSFCVLAVLWAAWNSAYADFYSGADLKRFLDASEAIREGKSGAAAVNAGVYVGYLAGITESFSGVYFCPPKDIGLREMTAIVADHLQDHPEKQEQSAQSLITRALGDAYPCSSISSQQ